MLNTTTHDTKRSEDVRLRLCLLSEIPQFWCETVRRWSALNEKHRRHGWPDRNLEYFYYQTLVGAWPLPLERALAVMEKSAREAKQHTSWTRPNPDYEAALSGFVRGTLGDAQFVSLLESFVSTVLEAAQKISLAETLLKLTTPGVPDTYQGSELWDLSLVDPDNRRPVDFDLRRKLAAEARAISAEEAWHRRAEGLPKLWLIRHTLRLRRAHPEWFNNHASYRPLWAHGAKAAHVVAFARGRLVVVVPRLLLGLKNGWSDTALQLPDGFWKNSITGDPAESGVVKLIDLLRRFPVALLVEEEQV
jgi:(1->4)-alpha-D-glucan 1-alpha-D-glucosylmutase